MVTEIVYRYRCPMLTPYTKECQDSSAMQPRCASCASLLCRGLRRELACIIELFKCRVRFTSVSAVRKCSLCLQCYFLLSTLSLVSTRMINVRSDTHTISQA